MEIATERVEIPVLGDASVGGGSTMGGYLARPTSEGPHPAVMVFMEIFGVNAHIRDVTERIAGEGYVALAPDYFHRTGPGVELGYDEDGFAEGMKLLQALKAEEMIADARSTQAYLAGMDGVRGDWVGAMGFCVGGHMTYLAACEARVCAAASFYGGGIAAPAGPGGGESTLSRTPGMQGRILCLFGGKDAYIPENEVEAIRGALRRIRHEVVVYPDCEHGFFCDQRDSYDADAASDAWERVKTLFDRALRNLPTT